MESKQALVGTKAPDFTLVDQQGNPWSLSARTKTNPVLLVFYPGDFTPVCTKQLCNYRDNFEAFKKYGVQIVGISKNTPEEHQEFAKKYDFQFPLVSDPENKVAKLFGCTSLMMFGGISRAVFVVDTKGYVAYRYIEPTSLTRRKADELTKILQDLRAKSQI